MLMPYLPEEIVINILSCLPVRSLLQFRCVSKSWCSLISSPDFAQSHLRKSLLSPTICKSRERVLLNDFPLHSINYNSSEPITDLHHPLLNRGTKVDILGSCNGLVCLVIDFDKSVILYNPATRKYRSIEIPGFPGECWGFGFDSNLQEYKIVKPLWGTPPFTFRVQVLRLVGSDQATICREVCCHREFDGDQDGVFLNGSIHWRADPVDGQMDVIVCFDLAREVFDEMPTPVCPEKYVCNGLGVLEGCLSLLECLQDSYNVWVMKEYGISTSWTVFFVLPRYIGTEYRYLMRPVTSKSEREIVIEKNRMSLPLDLRREQRREIMIFDLQEGTFETIFAAMNKNSYQPTVYVESLVSP